MNCSRFLFDWTLRWPPGMALAAWRYVTRTSPVYRQERPRESIRVPWLGADPDIQYLEQGVGPLCNRRFVVRVRGSEYEPEALLEAVVGDLNAVVPSEVTSFAKQGGHDHAMAVGDDYLVTMPGPWNGPVRVVHRSPTSCRFATRTGHLEAGQIEFRGHRDGQELRFEIELWVRSGDSLADLLYDKIGVAKEMQLHVWVHLCERVAALAGGELVDGIEVSSSHA